MDEFHNIHQPYFKAILVPAKILVSLTVFHLLSRTSCFAEAQLTSSLLPVLTSSNSTTNSGGLQFKQRRVLNERTSSILEWQVDPQRLPTSTITFTFSTTLHNNNENGVIFLGLSRRSYVEGADIAAVRLGGVYGISNAAARLVDMHGVNNNTLAPDRVQNWRLVTFQRNASQIHFVITRILDTCDDQDVLINNDVVRIVWGYGETSSTQNGSISFTPEGYMLAYLLDPTVIAPYQENDRVQTWRLSRRFQIPARQTSYWCTIHRGPRLLRKHHIVGFAPYFKDETSRRHVHHQLVYRCLAPPGISAALIYEKYVGHPGEECNLEADPQLPITFCTEMVHAWGIGGDPFFLPNDVGLAFGEQTNEYFKFETHYDNPESRANVVVENGVDFLYSPRIRPNEGSLIYVGTGIFSLFQVPPKATNFAVAGHCSPSCTKQMIPPSGIKVVAAMLHSHMTTRKMTFKHFRGNQELPWILSDDNYEFANQQMRLISEPRTVLPGDQLATRCVIDTTSRNDSTLSGFATTDEMCVSFVILNKRIPYDYCASEYPTERTMARYGVTNITWSRELQERVVNSADNPQDVGLTLTRVMDQHITSWTPEMTRELEREQYYEEHVASCPRTRYILQIGHALLFADRLTFGLIPGDEIVESFRPGPRTISTSLIPGLRTTRYPTSASTFVPQRTCPV